MSYNESKTVLRFEIPHLRGKSCGEVYEYFKPIIGEADEVDEWNGEIDYFHYERHRPLIPVFEMTYDKSKDDKVGVDYILCYENDYGKRQGKANHSIAELTELSEKVAKKFGLDASMGRVVSYTWYNGGDEPIYFE